MRSNWIYVTILGIACLMIGVNGNNTTSSSNSTGGWISSNMTSNQTQTRPPNITNIPPLTRPPNITTTLNQTRPPNITNIPPLTRPPNVTTTLNQTRPPNITNNLNQTIFPIITTNSTQTKPPNITSLTQTRPSNITTNPTQSGPITVINIITMSSSNTQSIEITGRDNCRRDRACFSAPPSCNPGAQGSCYFLSTRGVSGNANNFTFELSGETDGYIGAGLSRDTSGQGATVYSCANINGALKLIRSTLNNQILTQDNTFIPGSVRGSVIGKKIQCIFNAAGLSSTARAATTETFVFLLTGSVSNGSLESPVSKLATNGSVDLSNPNSTDVSVITSTNATVSNTTSISTTTPSTNLTQTVPPNMNANVTKMGPLNTTANLTQTRPPNITTNMTQMGPLNTTANLTQTRPPNITTNMTQMGPLNTTANLTQTRPPNTTANMTQMGPLNTTANLTQTRPPNITTNMTQMGPLNATANLTQTHPPNITTNVTQMGPLNTTANLTQTRPPNITTNVTQMGPLNTTANLTQTRPPNITTNVIQMGPLNATANLTQTRPPNITTNVTQMGPLNATANLTQTHPPNITTNLTPKPSGSNTLTNGNTNNPPLEITGRDNCKRDRACFSAPPSCNPGSQGSCYFLSTRGVSGNENNFTFELSGETDGYIGAGLSRDKSGQGATVYSCAAVNNELKFFRSTLNNQILTQDGTLIPGSFRGSIIGKKIQCIFTAAGLSSTARAATTDSFVFFLTGTVSNGSLDSPVTRLATNGSVDLSNPNSTDVSVITPSINTTTTSPNTTASTASGVSTANNGTNNDKVTKDNCKKDRACFSAPTDCDPSSSSSCFFASTRGVNGNSDNLTFELSGDTPGYIAVGLSRDKKGDSDTVYSCVNDNGVARFIRATLNNTILTPDKSFNPGSFRGSVNGTRIQCIFVAAGLSSTARAANTSAFLYILTGNYTNGTLGSPVTRLSTNSQVDLTNTNSSDVITPTTVVSTTAKPATTAGSNALHHAASQAALLILSGILAVLLL
ncbi:uncharacterized protein si:cabz01007794.1 isoform X2 [Carassius gibelio]|uniref:uncharacterized protein si:cabz01007794.1 isoform X2 n=1 Tax=Carassius gibelio TaxID=101364 RepID=UPI002277B81D|nr:uncharacterized protein si:cabz01007794.1 isoform X2 [Carassius gibelio]